MGLIQNLKHIVTGRLGLTVIDRQQIIRMFGSFAANKLGMGSNASIIKGYQGNVDVFSVIKKIADTSKIVPTIVERSTRDGFEIMTDTSLHELMAQPNEAKQLTWEDINEQVLIYLLSTGRALPLGLESIGFGSRIAALDVLPVPLTEISVTRNFLAPEKKYKTTINGEVLNFEGSEVGQINFFNPGYSTMQESCDGLSPIQVAAMVVMAGNDKWEAQASLLQNRGAIGMVTDKSNTPMEPEEAERQQQAFDSRIGSPRNMNKVVVTNKNLDFIQFAMSATDLKLIEQGVVNLRSICNVFQVDTSLFNDPANKTFNNRKEAEKALYTNAVMPTLSKIYARYNNWLVPTHFPEGNVRMRPDYSDIEVLQEDFHQKAKTYIGMKVSGIITAKTAAAALKQPEPPTDDPNADKLIISNNNILQESLGAEPPQE